MTLTSASQGNVQAVDHHFLTFEGEYSNSERIRLPTGYQSWSWRNAHDLDFVRVWVRRHMFLI